MTYSAPSPLLRALFTIFAAGTVLCAAAANAQYQGIKRANDPYYPQRFVDYARGKTDAIYASPYERQLHGNSDAQAGVSVAPAQHAPQRPAASDNEDRRGTVTLMVENDVFTGTDDGYTNGTRLSWISAESDVPRWLLAGARHMPFFDSGGNMRYGFAVGQNMYSPDDIERETLNVNDRPYAGWLYGTITLLSDTDRTLDTLQLTGGIVGPSSRAREVQEIVHDIIDSPDPQGWEFQLRDEPGVVLSYERKWRNLYQNKPFGFGFDVTPSLGASLGNVFTHGAAGLAMRLGRDLPADYGPPLIGPGISGSEFFIPTRSFGWYFFAAVDGRIVGRNIFLDGNTFRDSHSVDKNLFVGTAQAGLAVTFKRARFAYTHLLRSKEFEGAEHNEEFGAFVFSYRF